MDEEAISWTTPIYPPGHSCHLCHGKGYWSAWHNGGLVKRICLKCKATEQKEVQLGLIRES